MPPLATADSPNGRAADNEPPSGKATATPNGSAPATNEPVGLSSVSLGVPAPVPTEAGRLERIYEACLYLVFGLASGWTLVDAMMIQTARMGQTQPEGLALATVLGGWGTLANLLVVPGFYYLQRCFRWRISRWVWVGLLLQLGSALLGAVGWHVTLGPTSPCMYAVSFLSCIGGNLQQLAVLPWVQEGGTNPASVSWVMAGSNMGAVVCAILGAIQQPGHHDENQELDQRFSVSSFFAMVSLLVLLGIGSFVLLLRRRRAAAEPSRAERAARGAAAPSLDGTTSRLDTEQNDLITRRQKRTGACARRCRACCKCGRLRLPWYAYEPHVMRVSATNALVQLICWIFIRSLLPYAAAHAVGGSSAEDAQRAHEAGGAGELQGYAVEASLLAVFAGALISACLPNRALRLGPTALAMALPLVLLAGMALGWQPLGSKDAAMAVLIIAVVVARATDGLVTPLLYRVAGDPYPETERQAITQWAGVVAILAAAVGSTAALVLVLTGVID